MSADIIQYFKCTCNEVQQIHLDLIITLSQGPSQSFYTIRIQCGLQNFCYHAT